MTKKNQKNSNPGPAFESRFEEALRIRDEGGLVEAEKILSELEKENPEHLPIALVRAGLLFKMERFGEASKLFGCIVHLKPDAELASRGLFHSLWKLGRHDEALDEMKRFLLIADSEEYQQLLRGMMEGLRK